MLIARTRYRVTHFPRLIVDRGRVAIIAQVTLAAAASLRITRKGRRIIPGSELIQVRCIANIK